MRQIISFLFFIVLTSCYEKTQPKSEPIIVVAPKSKPSNSGGNDPSFLKIKIQNDNYEISLLNKILSTDNINTLDSFIRKNKDLINKDKVFVAGFENEDKYKKFKDLLSKHGISKFQVPTE